MPANYEKAFAQWERYQYARDNGHLAFTRKADLTDRYYGGDQWDPAIKAKLNREKRPALTINEYLSTLMVAQGEMVENRLDVSFKALHDGSEETASALDKVFLSVQQQNEFEFLEADMVDDGLNNSRGFLDLRINFNRSMEGHITMRVPDPRDVVLDPDATSYDPKEWREVFYTRWLSLDEIAMLYGEGAAKYLGTKTRSSFGYDGDDSFEIAPHGSFGGPAQRVTESDERRWARVLERQYRQRAVVPHFVDPVTGDMRMIPPHWSEPRTQFVAQQAGLLVMQRPALRIVSRVTADDYILFDGPFPQRTFSIVPFFPLWRRGRTIGLGENLISPQDMLNKSNSSELHALNSTANSGWKLKSGSLKNMTVEEFAERGAEPGLLAVLDDVADLDKITPNQIPTGLDRISFKASQYIESVSGIGASRRGLDRADVAAEAIKQKRAAGSTAMQRIHKNLGRTRRLIARKVLELVQAYYREPRIVKIRGRGSEAALGQQQDQEVAVNTFDPALGRIVNDLTLGEYEVAMVPVPPRDTTEDTQFSESVEMRQLGIDIPDTEVVRASHLQNKSEIVRQMEESASNSPQTQSLQADTEVKKAEALQKQADAKEKETQAALNLVRARKEAQETEQGGKHGAKAAETAMKQAETQDRMRRDDESHTQKLVQSETEFEQKLRQSQDKAKQDRALAKQRARRAS